MDKSLYQSVRAWPFEEARKVISRYKDGAKPEKGYILFETGYGPSGLPHIGTFGEVVRTTMVRQAFQQLSDIPTRLFAFSDDMDGLRKVPENVPNREMLAQHLQIPLTQVPDPFGKYPSFGEHNNAMLCKFLDSFGFEYELQSSTDWYKSGRFDQALKQVLRHYDGIMNIMLPTLGAERRATYAPILPICPRRGIVLQVPLVAVDAEAGTVTYRDDETGKLVELEVSGGKVKCQWKADWAMRWFALDVDYEMSGKDLIPTVALSQKICKVLGKKPPESLTYELFLDQKGEKISKSRGNGLSVEEWLHFAPEDSLSLYMFQQPQRAKRLYFDVIPKAVDEYLAFLSKFEAESPAEQLENPVWHIHNGKPPKPSVPISFAILLNLASVVHAEDPAVLWGFISRYREGVTPETSPYLARLVEFALVYYQEHIKPTKSYKQPDDHARAALTELANRLEAADAALDGDSDGLQTIVFAVGKEFPFSDLKTWFKTIYEVLLGQEQGPRMGSFIALYGRHETVKLIREKLA